MVEVNALKFTVMTPREASQVSPSMKRADIKAIILRITAATFLSPYPRRNPNVPPSPIWVARSVAKLPLSNSLRHAVMSDFASPLKIRNGCKHKRSECSVELDMTVTNRHDPVWGMLPL